MWTIYRIECVDNKKSYVGSSVNFERRIKRHFVDLRGGHHHSQKMQSDFRVYGEKSFQVHEIETVSTLKEAYEKETSWIAHFKSYPDGYNSTYDARLLSLDPEIRKRTSEVNQFIFSSEEYKDKCRRRAVKQFSDIEARKKASEKQKQIFASDPEKWREICVRAGKISAKKVREKLAKPIVRSDGKSYEAINDAAREMSLSESCEDIERARGRIKQALKRKNKTFGFNWSYKNAN